MECPICKKPEFEEIADEVDIGVGTQRRIYEGHCVFCGDLFSCGFCGQWFKEGEHECLWKIDKELL